jgi:hypothetical protein
MGVEENPRRLPALKEALMKIVLLVVGPLFVAVGLFWFGQGTGLFSGPHNAVLIDAGGGAVAMPCLVCIAVALAAIRNASEQRRTRGLL